MKRLLSLDEARQLASDILGKEVTMANINYLTQYGRIDRIDTDGGTRIDREQLVEYYASLIVKRESEWMAKLGNDINWELSFDSYSESQTTKHVHRLHPYKGKYIPQLVEYFLDNHTDSIKREAYFKPGDIVLDPFCGSGTTLVQANELGMHGIGIDISSFNSQISTCKVVKYDVKALEERIASFTGLLESFEDSLNIKEFDRELMDALRSFNNECFPSPEFRKSVNLKQVNEKIYALAKEKEFLPQYFALAKRYGISLKSDDTSFIGKWCFDSTRREIYYVNSLINAIDDSQIRRIMQIILSRAIRSCRATTHSDLVTLLKPIYTPYYCSKHKKICKPLFSILKWWRFYSKDTVDRIKQFSALRTETTQRCFAGDSSSFDVEAAITSLGGCLLEQYANNKISGIFCSPPYVGLIDYHEQHAYAYELFGIARMDDLEIGSMTKGTNRASVKRYIADIARVLIHCKQYLKHDYNVFVVANDKHGVYPRIAEIAGMRIVEQFKRPVLNRTERDRRAYSETVFRMQEL